MKKKTGIYPQSFYASACAVLISCMVLVCGCAQEPAGEIRKKLDVVKENDLRAIVGEVPRQSLADSVYTRVVEYKDFDKGPYRVKAMVDFFYLKGVHVKRTVKYRYVKKAGKWERYANDYIYY